MTDNQIINLLLVDQIDTVSQPLRDAGFIVQVERLEQEADVQAHIKSKPVDLVVLRPNASLPTVDLLRASLDTTSKTAPLFALIDADIDPAPNPTELLAAGVDALVDSTSAEHLQKTVRTVLGFRDMEAQNSEFQVKIDAAEARGRAILDNAAEAIAYIHEGVHIYVNPAYLQLFGYANTEDVEGITLMDLVAEDDRNEVKRFLRDSTKQGSSSETLELNGLCTDGSEVPMKMRCSLTRIDEEPCLQIFVADAREGAAAVVSANIDAQTGLYSRTFMLDYLEQRIQDEEKKAQGALLYILLDAYQPLNNRYGISAGDLMIKDLAPLVKQVLHEEDVLARFRDGAFAAFLHDANLDDAKSIADKICAAVNDNNSYHGESLLTTHASIGLVMLEDEFEDAVTLLSSANQATDTARKKGGGGYAIAKAASDVKKEDEEEDSAVTAIHSAISAERMRLLYQPVVSFADDSEERYQAIMQIFDENDVAIDVETLAPIAESTNLMLPLDKWAIVTALSAMTDRYQETQSMAKLFVRVSGNAINDEELSPWLEQRLSDTGLPGNVLIIEVTEETAEKHFKEVALFRERIKALGCGFALASFGGKANSQRILNHLTPDYIKLESELIEKRAKSKDASGREAMAALTQKAQEMNAQVVASEIANANQMASIWQFGVTLVQGDMVREPSSDMVFDFAEFAGG